VVRFRVEHNIKGWKTQLHYRYSEAVEKLLVVRFEQHRHSFILDLIHANLLSVLHLVSDKTDRFTSVYLQNNVQITENDLLNVTFNRDTRKVVIGSVKEVNIARGCQGHGAHFFIDREVNRHFEVLLIVDLAKKVNRLSL
jgi:hypothetical protein